MADSSKWNPYEGDEDEEEELDETVYMAFLYLLALVDHNQGLQKRQRCRTLRHRSQPINARPSPAL